MHVTYTAIHAVVSSEDPQGGVLLTTYSMKEQFAHNVGDCLDC